MEAVRERTDPDGYAKIKSIYEESFRFVNEGLQLEENGKKKEAVMCYEKGYRLLKSGLNLKNADIRSENLEKADKMKRKMEKAKEDVEFRLEQLRLEPAQPSAPPGPTAPSRPSPPQLQPSAPPLDLDTVSKRNTPPCYQENGESVWEDARTLISIEEGVRLFHVDQQKAVSTWSEPCQLKIFQLLGDHRDPEAPPAFLKCGEWIYPLHPGRSPALKTFYKTYMFPDISLQPQNGVPASVGIVLADVISEQVVSRFERILSCYCDFRVHDADDSTKEKPPRPPPPYSRQKAKEPSAPDELTIGRELVHARHGEVDEMTINEEDERSWSEKVSSGISIGAKWVSWGLSKGAEVTSQLVEQGAVKLRARLQPNEEPTKVSAQTSQNVQQIKEVTGAAVQVSSFIVTTLCVLTIELGKQLSPVIRSQGSKLIPAKYKNGDESGQKTMDDVVKVAAAGLRGFGTVFTSLEESGKVLYKSVTKATVQTVNHKYGDEASEVTGDAMAAAGNTAQAYWNVKKLGAKAIAKRAAKDTGKAMVMDENEKRQSGTNKALTYE